MRLGLITLLIILTVSGCNNGGASKKNSQTDTTTDTDPISGGQWYRPAVSATWQWQLDGAVNTSYDVEIYDIDLFDASETLIQELKSQGKRVICYFSAGSFEEGRPDSGQFSAGELGSTLDGWEGERWLDIRSANVQSIMQARLDLAAQKKCDGVEPDNVDGYANEPGFDLTYQDQLVFNRFIANQAHIRNLAVGLKNDLDQVNDLVAYFDFAVNEECFELAECAVLSPFISSGKPVLNAEYKQAYVDDPAARQALCAESLNLGFSTLILPLNLDDAFRYSCR